MSIIQHSQTGQDGVGQEQKVEAQSITLKAKTVTAVKNTTLRVTGLQTAATWTIDLVVRPGTQVLDFYPPAVVPDPPSGPTANFVWNLDELQV